MNILHVNASDGVGGAGRAAYRLHSGLRRLGYDSSMFVAKRYSDSPAVVGFEPPTSLPGRVVVYLRQKWIAHSMTRYRMFRSADMTAFSDDRVMYKRTVIDQLPLCDVLNLHWIARFVDYETFFSQAPRHPPVVWTLHDMNPFTGGCHYTYGCEKYLDGCGACPQLGSSNKNDLSHRIWQRKRECFEKLTPERLRIVSPSHWLAAQVADSPLLGRFPVIHVPNSVETDVFSPQDRRLAREILGIPQNARVVLFVARSLYKKHKGFSLLVRALSGLCGLPDLLLVSLGQSECPITVDVPHLPLGRLDDDCLLSRVYSAADLFVIPSLQDNLPNTVLESMACGAPVVGFEVGGIPDMVRPGVTGLLAQPGDADGLRDAVARLLQDPEERAEMGINCRRIALKEYALEVQACRYAALYENVLR